MASNPRSQSALAEKYRFDVHQFNLMQNISFNRFNNYLNQYLLPYKISLPEWKLLGNLYQEGKMRLSELSDKLNYDPPLVSKLAKKLEKRGLVKRSSDSRDERAKMISVTNRGEVMLKKIDPEIKKSLKRILKGVTKTELNSYMKVLFAIINNT